MMLWLLIIELCRLLVPATLAVAIGYALGTRMAHAIGRKMERRYRDIDKDLRGAAHV